MNTCTVCGTELVKPYRSTLCGGICVDIHRKFMDLTFKYAHPTGCENCWGDLHGRCSDECIRTMKEYGEFMKDLWSLVRIVYPRK